MIARDGEGATKLITIKVAGAKSAEDAKKAARAIARSPLVKAAAFGEDPNWGRIIAAIGNSSADLDPDEITLAFSDITNTVTLVRDGNIIDALGKAKKIMSGDELIITADLGLGEHEATAWGCDLTYDYIRINAKYIT